MSDQRRRPAGKSTNIEALADRLRSALPAKGLSERRMFGGVAFMLDGNMVAGTWKDGLLFRVGKEGQAEALEKPGASVMEMRGRPMAGYVVVAPDKIGASGLRDWLRLAVGFVRTLPAKPVKPKSARKKGASA